jgi:hypothetical protein
VVANTPAEPSVNDYAALVQRLDTMQRQIDENGRASKFPFVVSHGGVTDFQVIPSTSGDGTADILMGDGAGGKLLEVKTDSGYGTKIYILRDQQGATMMSTDAAAGFGVGSPSYPFIYSGFESLTLAGATSAGTATEIGRGVNFVYNPATFVQPRIRLFSTTNETAAIIAQWVDYLGNSTTTAAQTYALTGGVVALRFPSFAKNWNAAEMNNVGRTYIKAYCTTANPGNISATLSYVDGYGISQGFYDANSSSWAI